MLSAYHNRRWDGDYLAARVLLGEDAIGTPALYEARWDRFRPDAATVWRNEARAGAGLLWDLGPHLVDQAIGLFGWPDAMIADVATHRANAGADDYFELTLRYGAARAILSASTLVAATRPHMALHGTGGSWWTEALDPLEGVLRAGRSPAGPLPGIPAFRAGKDGERSSSPVSAGDPFAFYRQLAAAVRSGATPPVDAVEARDVVALIEAAHAGAPLPQPRGPGACLSRADVSNCAPTIGGDVSGQKSSDAAQHDHRCADAAGVSIKTVSRVFNDEPNVRQATRDRVLAAAATLDYHPNVAARSLAGRRSFLIGLAYENPSPNYVVDLQTGALDRLKGERYRLLVLPFADVAAASGKMQAIARASGLDGIVLAPPLCDDAATIAELEACGTALYADRAEQRRQRCTRRHDGRCLRDARGDRSSRGARPSPDRDRARRPVACLGRRAARWLPTTGWRPMAWRATRASRVTGAYTFNSGYEAGKTLLALAERPTAIFASNDDMAAGVLNAAYEAGVAVRRRCRWWASTTANTRLGVWPRLTTIHQPIRDMAREATGALLALIEDKPGNGTPVPHLALPYALVIRGSTASAAEPGA